MTLSLNKLNLFVGINDATFQTAIAELPVRTLTAGAKVFGQGDASADIYILTSGNVEISHQREDGESELVASLKPGDLFGEFSYLTGLPRSSSAITQSEASFVELRSHWLMATESKVPELRKRLLAIYRERVLTNILQANRVFAVLQSEEIKSLAPHLTLKRFENGAALLTEGASDTDLYVIKKGRVQVSKAKGGKDLALGEIGAGEVVGEMAVVTGESRSATVRALGVVEAMCLPGKELRAALNRYPELLENIENIVRSRAEQTRRALSELIDEIVSAAPAAKITKAKISLLVYPEYDARTSNLQVTLTQAGKFYHALGVLKISQTQLTIAADEAWKIGEPLKLRLEKAGQESVSCRGSFLEAQEGLQAIQFDYDTAEERASLEALVRQIATESGYGQSVTAERETAAAAIVGKEFKSRKEFISYYLTIMEVGQLTVAASKRLQKDAVVKVQWVINETREKLRLFSSGRVMEWKSAQAEIKMDPPTGMFKRKVEELCQQLITEKNDANWQKRRRQLARSGIRMPITFYDAARHPLVVGLAVVLLLGLGWVLVYLQGENPFDDRGSRRLKLMSSGSAVTLKAEEIRGLRFTPGSKEFEIETLSGSLRLPLTQRIRLNEFQRQQLEMMLVNEMESYGQSGQ